MNLASYINNKRESQRINQAQPGSCALLIPKKFFAGIVLTAIRRHVCPVTDAWEWIVSMQEERSPSGQTLERVIAAWQRAQAGLAADDMLISDERAVDVSFTDREEAEADVEKILRRMVRAMLYASLRENEAKELKNAMQQREQRYKARGDMLRLELFDILISTQRERFVAPEGTLSLRELQRSVVILDAEAIPDEYVTVETIRHPDKRKMHDDMDQGVVIPGAVLSNGGQGLSFRRARSGGVSVDDAVRAE